MAPNTKPDGADNPAGRALNRRVTIMFAVKAPARPTRSAAGAPPPPAAGSGAAHAHLRAAHAAGSPDTYQVTVDGLYREGDLAVLKLTITCASASRSVQRHGSGADFDGQPDASRRSRPPEVLRPGFSAARSSGFYLTDPTTGTEYIPAPRHRRSGPDRRGQHRHMATGDSYPVWVYLPGSAGRRRQSETVVLPGARQLASAR